MVALIIYRLDEQYGLQFSVGKTVTVCPTAVSFEDLTVGCYVIPADGRDVSHRAQNLRRKMMETYGGQVGYRKLAAVKCALPVPSSDICSILFRMRMSVCLII